MDTVTMTALRMNELASEIADRLAEQAAALRVRLTRLPSGARVIDAGVETDGRARRRARPGRDLHGRAGQRGLHPAPDRRRGLARASPSGPTIRPSPAWPRSTPAGRSRWTSSSRWARARSGRTPGWSASCSRSSATRRRPTRGVLVLEGRTLPTDAVAAWVAAEGPARSRRSSPSSSRPPRASRAACRSRPASSRPACTRWRRWASTCAGW